MCLRDVCLQSEKNKVIFNKRGSVNINRIIKNFFSLAFANIFGQVITFLITVYLARKFGPSDFGLINVSNAFVTYFAAIASLGLQTLGIIEIAKNKENLKKNVDSILTLRVLLSLGAYIILILTVIFMKKDFSTKLMILISGTSIIATSFYVDWIFTALQEMKYISYSVVIKNIVNSLIVILAISSGLYDKVYIVPIALAIATLLSGIYLMRVYLKKYKVKYTFTIELKEYKRLIANSWPFFFSGVFATVNSNISTIMLGFLKTNAEAGLYNAVYKIVSVLIVFVSLIFTPIYPLLIEYYNDKRYSDLERIVSGVRKIIHLISVPILVVSLFLSKETIMTVYGKDYMGATGVFTVLISYIAFMYIREIYGYQLTAWNMQKKYMKIVLISSSYNIISNLILVPRLGINAAAANTLISELINLVLMSRTSRSIVKLNYDNKHVWKLGITGVLISIFVVLFKNLTSNAFIIVGATGIVYVVLVLLTGAMTISELKKSLRIKG